MFDELFDRDCRSVAWTDGQHIFNHDFGWVAFISRGNAFSTCTSVWLGPVKGLSHQDRSGRVVLWSARETPTNSVVVSDPGMAPTKPMPPSQPVLPSSTVVTHRQREPLGGWSRMSFEEWLGQRDRPGMRAI